MSDTASADRRRAGSGDRRRLAGLLTVTAIAAGVLFILLAVGSLLFGKRIENGDDAADFVADGGTVELRDSLAMADDPEDPVHAYEMRGTFVLCLVFLAAFVLTSLLNWYLLTQLWSIGA